MALSSTIVWEVRSGSSDNNGGGFKTGASGTDFSQQTSPQYALTAIATAGTGATFLSASAASDMVGNIAHVVSGTNFTAGFYEITSVSVGVSVTCDANVCTGVGASGVINIGGALATIGKIGSASANQGAVAGNYIWVNGSLSLGGTTDTIACSGSTTSPIKIVGYGTTRGDGYLGRTNGNGPLITTNFPTITYTTGRLVISGTFIILDGIIVTSANTANATITTTGANGAVIRCAITNSSNASSSCGAIQTFASVNTIIFDCDVTQSAASGAAYALGAIGAGNRIIGNRVKSVSGPGILARSTPTIIFNTIFATAGIGIAMDTNTGAPAILFNTIVGGGADGINIVTGSTQLQCIIGNMITDNTGDGIDMVSTANAAFVAYTRTRDNANAIANGGGWITATNYVPVTTDTGGSSTDYVNAGSNDYSLIAASPATSAGIPAYASIGALQRSQTSSGGGGGASMLQIGGMGVTAQ